MKILGQNQIRYIKEGHDYLMFIEDETVMAKRIELYKKYNLAGISLWQKSFISNEHMEYIHELISK